jgi:AraC-like DNA-binding protein
MPIQPCKGKLDLSANGYELKAHGSAMFPCGAYFSDMTEPAKGEIPWHWHEEIEALVVYSGAAHLYVDGAQYILRKGEGAFINSNVLHSVRMADGGRCVLKSLVFQAEMLSGSAESVFEQSYVRVLLNCRALSVVPFRSDTKWMREAVRCILDAHKAYDAEEYGYEWIVRERLSHMWYLLMRNMQPVLIQRPMRENKEIARIKVMMGYLHEHCAEKIGLQQIAAAANNSERECLRCFRKTIGMPPIKYLLKYRVSVSARLLADTDLSVTEICMQAGFDDTSYFTKTFRCFMACTPTAYRKGQTRTDL